MATETDAAQSDVKKVLEYLNNDDYERAASLCERIKINESIPGEDAALARGIIEYIKWFSKGYRTWQISYDYILIRSYFSIAYEKLKDAVAHVKVPLSSNNQGLQDAFRHLSEMLCHYTWCENSFINNDPFAWERKTALAVKEEEAGLDALKKASIQENAFTDKECALSAIPTIIADVADWIREYLITNLLLHSGSNLCAQAYIIIFNRADVKTNDVVPQYLDQANKKRLDLRERSIELESELRANICHIQNHYDRLINTKDITYLRVVDGKLALSMSASFKSNFAKDILNEKSWRNTIFLKELVGKVKAATKTDQPILHSRNLPHDIFYTSVGKDYMTTMVVDLPSFNIIFLDDTEYEFKPKLLLNALGVCTISFELDIDHENMPQGMTSERIRAIQALISPHAGQISIGMELHNKDYKFDRSSICDIHHLSCEIVKGDNLPPQLLGELTIEDFRNQIHEHLINENWGILSEIIQHIAQSFCNAPDTISAESPYKYLSDNFDKLLCTQYYLRYIARHYLDIAKECIVKHTHPHHKTRSERDSNGLSPAILNATASNGTHHDSPTQEDMKNEDDKLISWLFDVNTGWYTYLYCTRIDEVSQTGELILQSVPFKDIETHPDTRGFIINTREARAGFDDWRFTPFNIREHNNLALIRSHDSDAMFSDEFHTFMYLPDDPQFLTAQYETTTLVMLRLMHTLRCYSKIINDSANDLKILGEEMEKHFNKSSNIAQENIEKYAQATQEKVHKSQMLRWESSEIGNLVYRLGFSRYKDHANLLVCLTREMKIESQRLALEKDMAFLHGLIDYFDNRMQKLDQDRKNVQAKQNEKIFKVATGILSLNSAIGLVDFFLSYNNPQGGGILRYFIVIFIILSIFGVVLYAIFEEHQKAKRLRKHAKKLFMSLKENTVFRRVTTIFPSKK